MRYFFLYEYRRNIRKNIRLILKYREYKRGIPYSEAELSHLVKNSYYNFSQYMSDFFYSHNWNLQKIKGDVYVEGLDILDRALQPGNGALVLTAHIGNWELAGIVTSLLGYPISAISIEYLNPFIAGIYKKKREEKGIEVLLTGSSPKLIIKALKQNRVLAVLGDRLFTERGVRATFLGTETFLPRGPATLAVKTGASFIAGFFVMEKKRYRHFFKDIPRPDKSLKEEEQIEFLIDRSVEVLEEVIMDYPDQWFNFSKMP